MGLKEQLLADLKAALREGDANRASVIRYLRNGIQYEEKARGGELAEDELLSLVAKQVKQRKESISAFEAGGRQDLVDKEKKELAVLELYLPAQLSRDDLVKIVRAVIEEVGASGVHDKGKVMGRLMPQVRGKADGALVNEVVTELLSAGS